MCYNFKLIPFSSDEKRSVSLHPFFILNIYYYFLNVIHQLLIFIWIIFRYLPIHPVVQTNIESQ